MPGLILMKTKHFWKELLQCSALLFPCGAYLMKGKNIVNHVVFFLRAKLALLSIRFVCKDLELWRVTSSLASLASIYHTWSLQFKDIKKAWRTIAQEHFQDYKKVMKKWGQAQDFHTVQYELILSVSERSNGDRRWCNNNSFGWLK